ncbi:MAG: HD domain-containing phosphohydrolase [Dehalococcoidia bacterium]|jgi:diguanylate cyclase (GGDEF)-like protein/putative nucleotidyltransferase with HDIG domain
MKDIQDDEKTTEQLESEIAKLKEQIAKLEAAKTPPDRKNDPEYFNERLEEEVARSTRYKYEISVLYIELDNLEAYSKKFGNEPTQEIVSMYRTILRDAVRNTDMYCQLEPGKTAVILPYTNTEGAVKVAERIRQTVERVFALNSMSTKIKLTATIGVASYPKDAVAYDHLVRVVTEAFSRGKDKGGNLSCTAVATDASSGGRKESDEKSLQNETFLQALNDEVLRSSRYVQKFSLMILSISNLENKILGLDGEARAKIMQAIYKLLNATMRTVDRNYLYTDTKFAVVLPGTDGDGAQAAAQKLIQSLTRYPIIRNNGVDVNIFANVGIACFPTDEVSKDGLIRRAEAALNQSIIKGNNQFMLASSTLELAGKNLNEWIVNLKQGGPSTIYNLLASLDLTEHYSRPHSHTVAKYSIAMAQAVGLPEASVKQLRIMALMHDVGKICIPASIITKAGALNAQEWEQMVKHPQYGAEILEQFPEFATCAQVVLAHHERWDGKGYPHKIGGDQIPLESQIIAVTEAYDDMVTPRPYKKHLSAQEAIQEIKKNAGTQFDPSVVKVFLRVVNKLDKVPAP